METRYECLDCKSTWIGHDNGRCYGCDSPRLRVNHHAAISSEVVVQPHLNPSVPLPSWSREKDEEEVIRANFSRPLLDTCRKREYIDSTPSPSQSLADHIIPEAATTPTPTDASEQLTEERKRHKKINGNNKTSQHAVPDSHIDYCMVHHATHPVSAWCQKSSLQIGMTRHQATSTGWQHLFDFGLPQAVSTAAAPPQDWYDALTSIELILSSMEHWPQWTLRRDIMQINVCQTMETDVSKSCADFFMKTCLMSNYITSKLIQSISTLLKHFVRNKFHAPFNATQRQSLGISKDVPIESVDEWLDSTDKFQLVIAKKHGGDVTVLDFDAAAYADLQEKVDEALKTHDRDALVLNKQVLLFANQTIWNSKSMRPVFRELAIPVKLFTTRCVGALQVSQIVFPDLGTIFADSPSYILYKFRQRQFEQEEVDVNEIIQLTQMGNLTQRPMPR